MQQSPRLSPYLTEVPLTDLDEALKREVFIGEIAVTMNGLTRSAWSVTPESSADRNSCNFTLAIGKLKSEKNYHWKSLRSTTVLGVITMPGFIIVTLAGNDSIAKLFIKAEESHPFNVEYFLEISVGLLEPWRTYILQIFGELEGLNPENIDVGASWGQLSKLIDRHAAGFTSKSANRNQEMENSEEVTPSKQRGKIDLKEFKKGKNVPDKRARAAPQSVLPGRSAFHVRNSQSLDVGSGDVGEQVLPATPAATIPTPGPSLPGKVPRPKQMASKKSRAKPTVPTPIPATKPLYVHPGLEDHDEVEEERMECTSDIHSRNPDISKGVANLGESSEAGVLVATLDTPSGRVDDILNILPRPSAPAPPKVRLESEMTWSANPVVIDLDPSFKIPDELETEISSVEKTKQGEDKNAVLRKRSLLNEKFARESEYMYIFGRDQLFELALTHMEPSDHRSGRIYRDYEKAGADDIKRNLILANYTKPVLTVMPNLEKRPRDWNECVNAGKFKIINGQHTWHAALSCLNDPLLRQTNPRIMEMKIWDVQVVWTEKVSHLHALSFKCNEGQNESRHLTSLVRAILHCRVLWEQEGRPPMVRKNAAPKKKRLHKPMILYPTPMQSLSTR